MINKNVLLITGASSDVGMALIKRVAENYSLIFAQYRNLNNSLCEIKKQYEDKVVLIQADLSKEKDINQMIDQIQQADSTVDHIVHLAAMKIDPIQFRKEKWNAVESHISISVKSIYLILQALLPGMVRQGYGKVIFMLSSVIEKFPPKFQSSYIMSKHALFGLMQSLAVEYIDYGITFNGISPDMIETKFLSNLPHWLAEQKAQASMLKRNLIVDDVVPTFEYFLSDGTDAITGQNFEIRNKL